MEGADPEKSGFHSAVTVASFADLAGVVAESYSRRFRLL